MSAHAHNNATLRTALHLQSPLDNLYVRLPGAPGIQMNVPAIYHNAFPTNIPPSSSPGTLSTSTLYDCWRSIKLPLFRPTKGTIICTLPL